MSLLPTSVGQLYLYHDCMHSQACPSMLYLSSKGYIDNLYIFLNVCYKDVLREGHNIKVDLWSWGLRSPKLGVYLQHRHVHCAMLTCVQEVD